METLVVLYVRKTFYTKRAKEMSIPINRGDHWDHRRQAKGRGMEKNFNVSAENKTLGYRGTAVDKSGELTENTPPLKKHKNMDFENNSINN